MLTVPPSSFASGVTQITGILLGCLSLWDLK